MSVDETVRDDASKPEPKLYEARCPGVFKTVPEHAYRRSKPVADPRSHVVCKRCFAESLRTQLNYSEDKINMALAPFANIFEKYDSR